MLTGLRGTAKLKVEGIIMCPAVIDLAEDSFPINVTEKKTGQVFLMCPPRLYDVDYVINPVDGGQRSRCLA